MNNSTTSVISDEVKAMISFEKGMLKTILIQIKKSDDLVAQSNTLTLSTKRTSTQKMNEMADLAVNRLIHYFRERYNVQTGEDYARVIEELSPGKIRSIQEDICRQVIKEESN